MDVLAANKSSDLSVVKETLTFNITGDPEPGSFLCKYGGVVASYDFYNSSDRSIEEYLAFADPSSGLKANITVNGKPITTEIRYTVQKGDGATTGTDIRNVFLETEEFPLPEVPVTKYVCSPKDNHLNEDVLGDFNQYGNLRFESTNSNTSIIYSCYPNLLSAKEISAENIILYVAGDVHDIQIMAGEDTDLTEKFTLQGNGVTTVSEALKAMLEKRFPEISAVDSYNILVRSEQVEKRNNGFNLYYVNSNSISKWFGYTLSAGPGEHIKNEVTVPLYPVVRHNYKPDIYFFEYYLSPAAGFQSFGSLDIFVNTDLWIVNPEAYKEVPYEGGKYADVAFQKTNTGYEAHFTGLPEGELQFSLSAKKGNNKPDRTGTIVAAGSLIVVTLLIVGLFVVSLIVFINIIKTAIKKIKGDW